MLWVVFQLFQTIHCYEIGGTSCVYKDPPYTYNADLKSENYGIRVGVLNRLTNFTSENHFRTIYNLFIGVAHDV